MIGDRTRSQMLVFLMISSTMVALLGPAYPVMASNETTSGSITGTEVWSGQHQLTGDVTVSPGAKLIIEPGSTISFPNGTSLDVRGNLCVGLQSCGASSNADVSSSIVLNWTAPDNESAKGECYGLGSGNNKVWIESPSCGEGVILRDSMDLSQSGMQHLHFQGAWGIPFYVQLVNQYKFAALILDGASPTLQAMTFENIATTSVLATNLAQPLFIGGEYIAGNDVEEDVAGQSVQVYGGGTPISPMIFRDSVFHSTNNGCGQRDGGRSAIWASETFIRIEDSAVASGDFGFSIRDSAGVVSNVTFNVNCNGIDVNGVKSVGGAKYIVELENNQIETIEGTGITAYDNAFVNIKWNDVSGSSDGSGIAIKGSIANIHNNTIGPIGGWNGLWLFDEYDVVAENNTILQTGHEPVVAGEYSPQYSPTVARLFLANNTIEMDGSSVCSSSRWWGGDFTCPAIMVHRTGATIVDNVINATGDAGAIRSTGGILDVRRNEFNVPGTGAILQNYNNEQAGSQQYGSLAFFSNNAWNGVDVTYNVSKSAVTVQSEYISSPPSGESPVILSWDDQEAHYGNNWQNGIIPTEVKACASCPDYTPIDFPLALNMDNNSTVFTFSNLSGEISLSHIKINTQPTKYSVQVQRAELVRFQTLVNGERVEDANILIEDALGNDLYSLETDSNGYTPWFALASNFHLDFRGLEGGDNPDGFADDEYEDSCSDGEDNDGDLLLDAEDPDCDHSAGTRELSLYRFTAYRFGFGYDSGQFTLTDQTYQDTISLVNLPPSISVTQDDGQSFRRIVSLTGSAFDGQWAGIYENDELAQWDQQGYVHSVEVKDPLTSEWSQAGIATDTSGSEFGYVSRNNHPFSSWTYDIDMSNMQEGDYTFQVRSFDGLVYSNSISVTIKLNTFAPTINVNSPSSGSTHSNGLVTFEGSAQDSYGCPSNCGVDISSIFVEIDGPNYHVVTETDGGTDWSWSWDYSGMPRISSDYSFRFWASDSDFCLGEIDECIPVVIDLTIDNRNSEPYVSLISPQDGQIYSAGSMTTIEGAAVDFDGFVTRVDIEVIDITNGNIVVYNGLVSDIESDDSWKLEWNSGAYMYHNHQYEIRVRSYDGYDYSDWLEIQITADNPLIINNNQPTFDNTDWVSQYTLYCEIASQSLDQCTKARFNLYDYFDDLDGIENLYVSVYDDGVEGTADDLFGVVINVGIDGETVFDPVSMRFYDDDMANWALNNVIFVATDEHGSKEISSPVSFEIVPITFTVNEPEKTTFSSNEVAIFTGTGLPGKTITVKLGGIQVNSTVVSNDSTWIIGIPGSMITKTIAPTFSVSGSSQIEGTPISPSIKSDGMGNSVIVIIAIVIIVLIGAGLYLSGLVSLEVENDEGFEEGVSGEESEQDVGESSEHPGWLWDPQKQEWVPDPDYVER